MFVLSSISRFLEFWSVNHTSIYENFELKGFKNIDILGKISINWTKKLLGANVYKTLESYWYSLFTVLQWANTTSVISSPFSSLHLYFHHYF